MSGEAIFTALAPMATRKSTRSRVWAVAMKGRPSSSASSLTWWCCSRVNW
jgi:hypothetical protein